MIPPFMATCETLADGFKGTEAGNADLDSALIGENECSPVDRAVEGEGNSGRTILQDVHVAQLTCRGLDMNLLTYIIDVVRVTVVHRHYVRSTNRWMNASSDSAIEPSSSFLWPPFLI